MKTRFPFRICGSLPSNTSALLGLALVVVLFTVAACGGGNGNTNDSSAPDGAAQETESKGVPTMPAPRFAAPTTMIDATKVAQSKSDATPEPQFEPDLAQGEDAYTRLCAECHSDDGTGVADKAETIVGVELEATAFNDLLRTGGGYGNEHLFGASKISDDGIVSLFAFVQTLSE